MRLAYVNSGNPEPLADLLSAQGHHFVALPEGSFADPGRLQALSRCDLVLNFAADPEGTGERAWVAHACQRLGVMCLGAGPRALWVASDRGLWRAVATQARIPLPSGQILPVGAGIGRRALPPPRRIRPVRGPIGTQTAWTRAEVREAVAWVHQQLGQPALIEQAVPGRRFVVALLASSVLPILELSPDLTPRAAVIHPLLAGTLGALARRVADALEFRHLGLCEFGWDGQGDPELLEVDPLPAADAPGSVYAAAAKAAGMDYAGLWRAMLEVVQVPVASPARMGAVQ